MSLRQAVNERHTLAEEHPFTKALFTGKLSKQAYGDFLFNILYCYQVLENVGDRFDLFDGLDGIKRASFIKKDLESFDTKEYKLRKCVLAYGEHVDSLTDKEKLMAHVYVRYLGDLYGGQMLKKVVPSTGHMYEFEDRPGLIAKIRARLNDEMGAEANKVFEYTLDLFDELSDFYGIQ